MLAIYLCDDEPVWLKRLHKIISDYKIQSDWAIQIIFESTNPENLIPYMTEHPRVGGIYFLDIDFKTTFNGMMLAQQIRKMDPYANIIFITTHEEMVMATFRLKLAVLDYIVKDTAPLAEQVYSCLQHIEQRLLNDTTKNAFAITMKLAGSYYAIPIQDIYFIESVKNTHKICIHMHSSFICFANSLTATRARLDDNFIQCHRTCVVNVKHIKSINYVDHEIRMNNNECCYCSSRSWKRLLKKYCVNLVKV